MRVSRRLQLERGSRRCSGGNVFEIRVTVNLVQISQVGPILFWQSQTFVSVVYRYCRSLSTVLSSLTHLETSSQRSTAIFKSDIDIAFHAVPICIRFIDISHWYWTSERHIYTIPLRALHLHSTILRAVNCIYVAKTHKHEGTGKLYIQNRRQLLRTPCNASLLLSRETLI